SFPEPVCRCCGNTECMSSPQRHTACCSGRRRCDLPASREQDETHRRPLLPCRRWPPGPTRATCPRSQHSCWEYIGWRHPPEVESAVQTDIGKRVLDALKAVCH